jgi:hypothetical protein
MKQKPRSLYGVDSGGTGVTSCAPVPFRSDYGATGTYPSPTIAKKVASRLATLRELSPRCSNQWKISILG